MDFIHSHYQVTISPYQSNLLNVALHRKILAAATTNCHN